MPKFQDEIDWVKRVAHSIATANGHDDPDGYAAKVAEVHAAKAPAEPDAPPPPKED
jgi:hypothetical protein